MTLPAPKPGQPILTGAAAPVPTVVWVTNKPIPPTGFVPHINTKQAEVAAAKSERRVKQLLGELYEDKEYLSKLTKDKDFSHNPNVKVTRLVGEALSYLDNRAEFWRQQKPVKVKKRDQAQLAHMIEARNLTAIFDKGKEAKLRIEAKEKASAPRKVPVSIRPVTSPRKASVTNALPPPTPSQKVQESEQQQKIVQSTFELIHHAMQRKDYEVALRSARSLLARLTELRGLQNRDKTTADLFHLMGAIYQHLCNPTEALMYYRKEHSIGKEHRDGLIISRALSDMSRILVKSRKYKEAVSAFEEKIPYSSELSIERAWLYHDLGRCYLELKNDDRALDLGLRSASIADDLKDRRWGMNARLLIAQAQGISFI